MTPPLSRADINAIQMPPGVDVRRALRDLNTESWQISPEYRRDITYDSPWLFAIIYMSKRLDPDDTGLISFSWFHLDLCRSARRWMMPGAMRDAWIAPRESGKSAWMFGILPLWALAHGHRRMFLAFSYIEKQSRNHVKNMLNNIRTNELLRHDFPGLVPVQGQASAERTVLTNGATLASYGMQGTSLGAQSADGGRPDLIVGDDLEPGEADNTDAEIEKNRSRLLRNILPMGRRAVVQVTGTVTRDNSLIHGFVHAAKGRPQGDWVAKMGFEPHHYPALNERGESPWPQKWSTEELCAMRAADPHGFALNYDNDPAKPTDLTYWTPELFRYDSDFPTVERVLYIDIATTTGKTADYTAMVMLGRDVSQRRAVLERVEWGRWPTPQISRLIHSFCDGLRIKPLVLVECNQGGATLLDSLAPWPVGVEYKLIRNQDPKFDRIRRGHKQYYARRVWHAEKWPELEKWLCDWPRAPKDDVPDAVAGALEWAFPVSP
jgi:hypothetical protein